VLMKEEINKLGVNSNPPGAFSRFIAYISKFLDPVIKYGGLLAGFMLFGMMVLTFFDIAGAQIGKLTHIEFFRPIVGGYEVSEFMMCILISFGLGYCALNKGHIRVDLLLQYTSKKVTHLFDIVAYALSFAFYVIVAWQGWLNAWDNLNSGGVSTILLVPLFPFNVALVLGAVFIALVFFRDLLRAIEGVTR
jgi:TRAP-type C4-dicarboxylate transport system permease small subunit